MLTFSVMHLWKNAVWRFAVLLASRTNNVIVLFLGTVEKTREVIEQGVVIRNTLTPVLPLSTPSFIKDVLIERELQRY